MAKKKGRPTVYNKKVAEKICQRLSGGESLRSVCRDEEMPAMSSVLLWVVTPGHPFSDQYAQAREAAGYAHADRIIDTVEKTILDQYDPQQAKVIMDGLKWAAERMAPKKHSPNQKIDINDDENKGPLNIKIEIEDAKKG